MKRIPNRSPRVTPSYSELPLQTNTSQHYDSSSPKRKARETTNTRPSKTSARVSRTRSLNDLPTDATTAPTPPLQIPGPPHIRTDYSTTSSVTGPSSTTAHNDIATDTLRNDRLGTLVASLTAKLDAAPDWETFVRSQQGSPFISSTIETLPHAAALHLADLRDNGVPATMADGDWTAERLDECMERGCHKSATEHRAFVRDEMADNIEQGFWMVLRYDQVKDLPNLHLSPLGVKDERERRPCLVVDHTWFGVNDVTLPHTPKEAMQFGGTLPRILYKVRHSNPAFGPIYLAKYDISDGFYRMHLAPRDAPALATILPRYENEPQLVAIPLSTTMGWVNSPPEFCGASETAADVANSRLYRQHAVPHRLEDIAGEQDEDWDRRPDITATMRDAQPCAAETPTGPHSEAPKGLTTAPTGPTFHPSVDPISTAPTSSHKAEADPLSHIDVFVDDFLALVQGSRRRRKVVRRLLLHTIDEVFAPPSEADAHRREPTSLKKLLKGDGAWATRKLILGWIIDTLSQTIELPEHRKERIKALFDDLRGKRRVGVRKWQKILGELRFVSLAVPGSGGLFSALQLGLKHADKHRVKITQHIRHHIDDFERLATSLAERPTRLAEIVPDEPTVIGASDAAKPGMGGVMFAPESPPVLWRFPFPADIQSELVSEDNMSGKLTNSDLEQTGVLAQAMVATTHCDLRERTLATLSDNTPAVSRFRKGAVTSDQAAAYLCRLSSLHQRSQRYYHSVHFIPGAANVMADDASRCWHLSDSQLIAHFESRYPQNLPWQLCHLTPEQASELICSLQRKLVSNVSSPRPKRTKAPSGPNGLGTVPLSTPLPTSRDSTHKLKSTSCWYLPSGTVATSLLLEPSPVKSPSELTGYLRSYVPSARGSPGWVSQIPACSPPASSNHALDGSLPPLPRRTLLLTGSGPSPSPYSSRSGTSPTPVPTHANRQPLTCASSRSSSSAGPANTPIRAAKKKAVALPSPSRMYASPPANARIFTPPRAL